MDLRFSVVSSSRNVLRAKRVAYGEIKRLKEVFSGLPPRDTLLRIVLVDEASDFCVERLAAGEIEVTIGFEPGDLENPLPRIEAIEMILDRVRFAISGLSSTTTSPAEKAALLGAVE